MKWLEKLLDLTLDETLKLTLDLTTDLTLGLTLDSSNSKTLAVHKVFQVGPDTVWSIRGMVNDFE